MFNAFVTDVPVMENELGDSIVRPESIVLNWPGDTEALIVRTPGIREYKGKFTGTNPVYFHPSAIDKINASGIEHILVEWPSLDREEDGGVLAAHHAFWLVDGIWQKHKTITELIRLPENIKTGKYVLNLQVLAINLDVSPSRPVLYDVKS
jgi:kynurenine formamidase